MVAIGMALVWGGYYIGLWGYSLVQGYDLPFTALIHTTWPGGQAPATVPASGARATGTTQAPGTTTAGGRG